MGAKLSYVYYDLKVKDTPYPEYLRSDLYRYAYFFDDKENILYRQGYEIPEDCTNPVFHKAYERAILNRYPENKNDNYENFKYINSLPRILLSNCAFQKKLNLYYNKDIIDWVLYYRSIKNCHS